MDWWYSSTQDMVKDQQIWVNFRNANNPDWDIRYFSHYTHNKDLIYFFINGEKSNGTQHTSWVYSDKVSLTKPMM